MNNPYGIKGLPNEWVDKIAVSKISPEEVKEDPKGMIHMISKFEEDIQESKIERQLLSTE